MSCFPCLTAHGLTLSSRVRVRSCLREVEATVDKAKPVMCTHEADKTKGGGPLEEIKAELEDQRLIDAVFAAGRRITIWYRIAEVCLVCSNPLAFAFLL